MKTKILTGILAAGAIVFGSACTQSLKEDEFRIKGSLSGLNQNYLMVLIYPDHGKRVMDTIPHQGENFDVVCNITDTLPAYAMLVVRDTTQKPKGATALIRKPALNFFVSPRASVHIKGEVANANIAAVSGGRYNDDVAELAALEYDAQFQMNQLHEPYNEAMRTRDTAVMRVHTATRDSLRAIIGKIQDDFIAGHPNSVYAAYLYSQNVVSQSLPQLEAHFARFGEPARNSVYGKAIAEYIQGIKATSPGSVAPDFSQIDKDGKTVKLSDYRGKYVLLDFWGSWCGPCRASHPHLVELYKKYKGDLFEILGLAGGETKRENWLKAIKEDHLTWPQFNMAENTGQTDIIKLYNIRAFPTKILIDPQGVIQVFTIGGSEEIDKKLKEVFGQ